MANAAHDIPLYIQIAKDIEHSIERGELGIGDKLMSELGMAQHYHVSRVTVRRALADLEQRGLVVSRQGMGTFVSAASIVSDFFSRRQSFLLNSLEQKKKPSTKILSKGVRTPDEILLRHTELSPGESMIRIERLRYSDDTPVTIEYDWFPQELAQMLGCDLQNKSLLRTLENDFGLFPANFTDFFRTESANAYCARRLCVPEGFPLLCVFEIVSDKDDRPIYYNDQIINPAEYAYTIKYHV